MHGATIKLPKFLIWIPFIRTCYVYVSKDLRIRGNFSKPQGVGEHKSLGNSYLNHLT